MPDFVDHPRGPTGERVIAPARMILRHDVNEALNLNVASENVQWGATLYGHPDFTEFTEAIECNFDGMAWFSTNLHLITPSVQRANLLVVIMKTRGGAVWPLVGTGAMGYIRFASAHEESSIYLRAFDHDVQDGDIYRVNTVQEAAAGTVTAIAAGSYFAAERVA